MAAGNGSCCCGRGAHHRTTFLLQVQLCAECVVWCRQCARRGPVLRRSEVPYALRALCMVVFAATSAAVFVVPPSLSILSISRLQQALLQVPCIFMCGIASRLRDMCGKGATASSGFGPGARFEQEAISPAILHAQCSAQSLAVSCWGVLLRRTFLFCISHQALQHFDLVYMPACCARGHLF